MFTCLFFIRQQMRYSTHGVYRLVVSSWVLHALIFQFPHLYDALQLMNSVVRLARTKCYYKYRGLKYFRWKFYLLLFYKPILRFIRGHMLHTFLINVQLQSDCLRFLPYACQCGPSRVGSEVASPPIFVPDVSIVAGFCLIGVV